MNCCYCNKNIIINCNCIGIGLYCSTSFARWKNIIRIYCHTNCFISAAGIEYVPILSNTSLYDAYGYGDICYCCKKYIGLEKNISEVIINNFTSINNKTGIRYRICFHEKCFIETVGKEEYNCLFFICNK